MSRTALLLSCLFVAACTVGEIPSNRGTGGTDAGNTQVDAAPVGNGCVNRAIAGDPHIHTAGGTANAGQSCIVAGCHLNNQGGGPGFQFAGTVYKADGTTPSAGVTIRITGAGGASTTAITDTAGNFSLGAGTLMAAFPATTNVTACPNVAPMAGQLVQGGGGNCNSCHAKVGGTTGVITIAD